jgi:hypothetical protein
MEAPVICTAIGCHAESPEPPENNRESRGRLAAEAGFRFWYNGKEPKFTDGAALCARCQLDPKELKTATTPRGKR